MSDSLEHILARDGFIIHSVHGNSMNPMLFESTDLVKIVPLSRPLALGDLPLYQRPNGQYVLHRIIALKKSHCVTCGDNRSFAESVPFDWILGVAEGFYRNGSYTPCDDPVYLRYVADILRRRRPRAFLLRFKLFRALRAAKISLSKRIHHD